MQVIGIAGTAKNTGKTTTTASIISQWQAPRALAVTSIGYDGESRDNVTGLPKPRLHLPAGALVVTAEKCLGAGSARLENLEKTELATPLGRLVISRVRQGGLAVLAGPNSLSALKFCISRLRGLGTKLLLVDGALGRLAPMAAADGLVLATGAARSRDLLRLAQETGAFAALLNLPRAEEPQEPALRLGSMLVEEDGREYAQAARGYRTVVFAGVAEQKPLARFLEGLSSAPALVFADPTKLLFSADLVETAALLRGYRTRGGRVGVVNPLPLKGVTVNPFFPDFNEADYCYAPGYVDALALHEAVARSVSVPVVDVIRQGGEELAKILDLE